MPFLSIYVATIRPNNIIGLLKNLEATADDVTSFEVLIKIDEGEDQLQTLLEAHRAESTVQFRAVVTPKLDGYYTLHEGYNALMQHMSPESYFCWLFNDELRIETQGWDSKLREYIGFYDDDIFRLKTSQFQNRNYYHLYECFPCPDNYAVVTRKWLEITGGWGKFWGPDSWHQAIDYFLGMCENRFEPESVFGGVFRSVPLRDIRLVGEEAGLGMEDSALVPRSERIRQGWKKMLTFHAQENFLKLAQKLNMHIWAMGMAKGDPRFAEYEALDNPSRKEWRIQIGDEMQDRVWTYNLPVFIRQRRSKYQGMSPQSHFIPALYLRAVWSFATRKRQDGIVSHLGESLRYALSTLMILLKEFTRYAIIDLLSFTRGCCLRYLGKDKTLALNEFGKRHIKPWLFPKKN